MRKLLLVILAVTALTMSYAQQWNGLTSATPAEASTTLISSESGTTTFSVTVPGYFSNTVSTEMGDAIILDLEGSTPLLSTGSPAVPKVAVSIQIPDAAAMDYEIVSFEYEDIENVLLAPSKGSLSRTVDPSDVPYTYGEEYAVNDFYPATIAQLNEPYIIRDVRGMAAWIYPFRYNPVTQSLRVYTEVVVKVFSTDAKAENILKDSQKPKTQDALFAEIYRRHFINGNNAKYTPLEENGKMLIISYSDFTGYMQPLADWRRKTGHPTEIVDVATIGASSSAIKDYIANYYNTQGLTYVLLVGDAAQVPPSYSNGDSDNDYAYITGSDHYPELFIGRFSAEDTDQVMTMVTRTIDYEKTPFSGSDWHKHNIGIGSNQGPGDDNEYDYEHIRNIQQVLEGYTYTVSEELFDGSQGGDDEPGNPTPSMVATDIENGASLINYVGHGSTTSWSTSGFSNSDVNNLTNTDLLPYIISVACVNGNFVNTTCFAEAWIRATHNNNPSGAVAIVASTINQDWDEPMEGQDAMNDILSEVYPDNIKRTFGGVTFNGMMQMMDSYGSSSYDMMDTWTIFGDPALMIRTDQPMPMTVDHPEAIYIGLNEFTVECNKNGALATLFLDDELIDSQTVANGEVTFTFDPFTEMCDLDLTISAYNCIPHIETIPVLGGAPGIPGNPEPADLETGISLLTTYQWQFAPGGEADEVTFFLGTDNPPTNVYNGEAANGNTFESEVVLNPETEYFWQIKATNDYGTVDGPVWSFTSKQAPDDDFETGDFSAQAWKFDGDADWVIDDQNARAGQYSARSGVITDGQNSTLKIEIESMTFGQISFWTRTSCETENDKLDFIVNGNQAMTWTGDMSGWTEYSYFIGPGPYVFEWTYSKDANGGAMGEDCAWIDFVYLPTAATTVVQAGEDQVICSDNPVQLEGAAYNYTEILWTTDGDGSFDDHTALNAIYTPGDNDITAGTVTLTLSATGSNGNAEDEVIISFVDAPEVYAGEDLDACSNDALNLGFASAENYSTLMWTTSGDGSFDDPAIVNAEYTFGTEDINNGSVILTLTASGNAPCATVSAEVIVSVMNVPEKADLPQGPQAVDLVYTTESTYEINDLAEATAYDWVIEPENAAVLLPQDDGEAVTAQWNPEFEGVAMLKVRGMNDCGEGEFSDDLEIVIDNTVGIDEVDNSISIFPNPSNGAFKVQYSNSVFTEVNIFNLTGEMIFRSEISSSQTETAISLDLNAGVYFITIIGEKESHTERLIVK